MIPYVQWIIVVRFKSVKPVFEGLTIVGLIEGDNKSDNSLHVAKPILSTHEIISKWLITKWLHAI